jgi:hypothetical protein
MMSRATMVTTVMRTTQPASRQTIRLMIFGLQTGPGPQPKFRYPRLAIVPCLLPFAKQIAEAVPGHSRRAPNFRC